MKKVMNKMSQLLKNSPKEEIKEKSLSQQMVERLITKIKEQNASDATDNFSKIRGEVAALVLPNIVVDPKNDGDRPIDRKVAKDWARAFAQTIGLIAGMAVKPDRIDAAIAELLKEAKETAHQSSKELSALEYAMGVPSNLSVRATQTEPKVDQQALKDEATRQAKQRHIDDLKAQALTEQNEAAKQALLRFAETLEKELEIEGKTL